MPRRVSPQRYPGALARRLGRSSRSLPRRCTVYACSVPSRSPYSPLRTFTGQGSTLAVVPSTLAIATLFGPLRRQVQSFVDRRFYRRKYDATKTLAAFNARLRDQTDLGALRDELVGVVRPPCSPNTSPCGCAPIRLLRSSSQTSRALRTQGVRGRGALRTSALGGSRNLLLRGRMVR
jgi:hypothetical protein